ncbi:MAG: ABC transporter substrate-binding protein [Spirochaetaceae bacterium]|nr:ABC transporter substrate-binding protein [Spirochaetaceae bacterium]
MEVVRRAGRIVALAAGAGDAGAIPTTARSSGASPCRRPASTRRRAPSARSAWRTYIAYLNATGGIKGRPVRMETRDSGSEPEQAIAVFKQIMAEEEDVVAFYGGFLGQ